MRFRRIASPTMSNTSRRKGKNGELQFAAWIRDRLPNYEIQRNYDQAAVGGFDLVGLPGIAIEVKRRKTGHQHSASWWTQICEAAPPELVPTLAYRFDGTTNWRIVVPLDWCLDNPISNPLHRFACLPAEDWIEILRPRLNNPEAAASALADKPETNSNQ